MLRSHQKCATAIYCFCDLTSISPVFIVPKSAFKKKLLVKSLLFYGLTKKHFPLSLFSTKLFQKIFSCQNIGAKTTEYYFLTIIDHYYVISFWYSRNIESP